MAGCWIPASAHHQPAPRRRPSTRSDNRTSDDNGNPLVLLVMGGKTSRRLRRPRQPSAARVRGPVSERRAAVAGWQVPAKPTMPRLKQLMSAAVTAAYRHWPALPKRGCRTKTICQDGRTKREACLVRCLQPPLIELAARRRARASSDPHSCPVHGTLDVSLSRADANGYACGLPSAAFRWPACCLQASCWSESRGAVCAPAHGG